MGAFSFLFLFLFEEVFDSTHILTETKKVELELSLKKNRAQKSEIGAKYPKKKKNLRENKEHAGRIMSNV